MLSPDIDVQLQARIDRCNYCQKFAYKPYHESEETQIADVLSPDIAVQLQARIDGCNYYQKFAYKPYHESEETQIADVLSPDIDVQLQARIDRCNYYQKLWLWSKFAQTSKKILIIPILLWTVDHVCSYQLY